MRWKWKSSRRSQSRLSTLWRFPRLYLGEGLWTPSSGEGLYIWPQPYGATRPDHQPAPDLYAEHRMLAERRG